MIEEKQKIEELKRYILTAEENLESAKKALFDITGEDLVTPTGVSSQTPPNLKASANGKVIEGIFNGENMIGPEEKIFPVPANYASKSKLIEGDKLKLTVAEDGSFIFKQIGPAARKNLVGSLVFEDNMYHVEVEGKRYNLLYASVTYHKAKPGDKVTIVVPAEGNSTWAALENIIHDVATKEPEAELNIFDNKPAPESPNPSPPLESPVIQAPEPLSEPPEPPVPPAVNDLGEALPAATASDEVADLEI